MDLFEHIVAHIKKDEEEVKGCTPEGLCPVCWGYQEYDQKVRKLFKDDQIDVIHHKKSIPRFESLLKIISMETNF